MKILYPKDARTAKEALRRPMLANEDLTGKMSTLTACLARRDELAFLEGLLGEYAHSGHLRKHGSLPKRGTDTLSGRCPDSG